MQEKLGDFRVIASSSDVQIAVSHFIAAEVERGLTGAAAPSNVHTVYNGVVHGAFAPSAAAPGAAALREGLGLPEDAVTFLSVGAVVPEKGTLHLARAFCELARQHPRAHLLVAGSASLWDMAVGEHPARGYEAAVADTLRSLSEAGRVHLLGAVKSSQMPAVYALSDVVVVPSVWPEPFPLVVLETLAAGKPLIASNVGGLPETVGLGAGRLVAPADEAALGEAMKDFLDAGTRRSFAGRAFELSKRFSWDDAAAQLNGLYTAAAPSPRPVGV